MIDNQISNESFYRKDVNKEPLHELIELDCSYKLKISLPNISKKHLKIIVSKKRLEIRGKLKYKSEGFKHKFKFSEILKQCKVRAIFNNDILSIKLPKSIDKYDRDNEIKIELVSL